MKKDIEIKITRVKVEYETVKEDIPFDIEYEETDTLYSGEESVKEQGTIGQKEIKYKKTLKEGSEESKEIVEEKILKEPKKEIVLKGTKDRPSADAGNSGSAGGSGNNGSFNYSKVITGTGTAYCDYGTTASGHTAGWDYAAVNPNVIPYGTRMYIRTTDGAYERYCIASDTGGALASGRVLVDLWFPDEAQCAAFRLREIEVYFLD